MPNREDQILNILPSGTLPQTFEYKSENLMHDYYNIINKMIREG